MDAWQVLQSALEAVSVSEQLAKISNSAKVALAMTSMPLDEVVRHAAYSMRLNAASVANSLNCEVRQTIDVVNSRLLVPDEREAIRTALVYAGLLTSRLSKKMRISSLQAFDDEQLSPVLGFKASSSDSEVCVPVLCVVPHVAVFNGNASRLTSYSAMAGAYGIRPTFGFRGYSVNSAYNRR